MGVRDGPGEPGNQEIAEANRIRYRGYYLDGEIGFYYLQSRYYDASIVFFCEYITAQSVSDIYYLTHRLTHSDAETRKILSKLFTLFHLMDTTSLDCRKAISSEISDYEDAIMVETAIRSEMDCIVTRNVKDYAKSPIMVYEPTEFVSILKAENEAE